DDDDDDDDDDESDISWSKTQAIAAIERSLELAPRHRPTYDLLVQAYEDWGEPEKLEAARLRILEVFPDDLETLTALASSCSHKNPARAREFVERARKLKPLDEALEAMEFGVRVSVARQMALEKRWDEGRAQFEAAGRLRSRRDRRYVDLGRR